MIHKKIAISLLVPFSLGAQATATRIPSTPPVRTSIPASSVSLVSEDMIKVWLAKWQTRLGLNDWSIDARVVRVSELPKNSVAKINWNLAKRKATISVINSTDRKLPTSEIPRDTELSVVHELIHLSMARLPLDPTNTGLEEETVQKISTALFYLQNKDSSLRDVTLRPSLSGSR